MFVGIFCFNVGFCIPFFPLKPAVHQHSFFLKMDLQTASGVRLHDHDKVLNVPYIFFIQKMAYLLRTIFMKSMDLAIKVDLGISVAAF